MFRLVQNIASNMRLFSVGLLLRVLSRGEEWALAPPAWAPGPRLLTLGRLHLLLRLLLVLLAVRSLVAWILALVLIQVELKVCTLFDRVVEVDVCLELSTHTDLVLVPVVDTVVLLGVQGELTRVQECTLIPLISCVFLLHEVVPLNLLADLAATSTLALPGVTMEELLFEGFGRGRPDSRSGGSCTRRACTM